ncbi:MAG TPA: hypothetical protein VFV19_13355 [Candidatus Polarisedimenticolaceae bacterium]|nr:hypothetical protein [Candidatus Polarisedimenticolaceae bacterium]
MAWVCGIVLAGAALAAAPAPEAPKPAEGPNPSTTTGPQPKIAFDKTELDLGDVVRGDDAVATFTYHNAGTAPLHILSAKPG